MNARELTRHVLEHETDLTPEELLDAMQGIWARWHHFWGLAGDMFFRVRGHAKGTPENLDQARDEARVALAEVLLSLQRRGRPLPGHELTAIMIAFEERWLEELGMTLAPFDRIARRFHVGYRGEPVCMVVATCERCGHAEPVFVRRSYRDLGRDTKGVCLECGHLGLTYGGLH